MKINRSNKGFSLFELMLTVSLMGLLLSLGLTGFTEEINRQTLSNSVQQVVLMIKEARYNAKVSGIVTKLTFSVGTGDYSLQLNGQNLTQEEKYGVSSGKLPDKVKFLSNNCNSLNFFVDGTLVNSVNQPVTSKCKVVIGFDKGPETSIYVQPGSGIIAYD